MSTSHSVQTFISDMIPGTVFSIQDITVDTTYDSIKTQISEACSKGTITRILRGIYYKPKFNTLISKNIPYNMTDVINTIARMNKWYITPSGNTCMNIVGLSTQVPSKYVFLSDGPYKKYNIEGITIEFKHRAPKNHPKSIDTAILIQAIKAKGIGNIDHDSMIVISNYIKNNDIDINEVNDASSWIKNIIKEAYNQLFKSKY